MANSTYWIAICISWNPGISGSAISTLSTSPYGWSTNARMKDSGSTSIRYAESRKE
jgi:hypothetical protein